MDFNIGIGSIQFNGNIINRILPTTIYINVGSQMFDTFIKL